LKVLGKKSSVNKMKIQREDVKVAIKGMLEFLDKRKVKSLEALRKSDGEQYAPWGDEDFIRISIVRERDAPKLVNMMYFMPSHADGLETAPFALRVAFGLEQRCVRVITCCEGGFDQKKGGIGYCSWGTAQEYESPVEYRSEEDAIKIARARLDELYRQ